MGTDVTARSQGRRRQAQGIPGHLRRVIAKDRTPDPELVNWINSAKFLKIMLEAIHQGQRSAV